MTTLADTASDVLRRIYDPKPPMSPDQYLDRVAMFVHPDTLAVMFKANRLEYRRIGGVGLGAGSEVYFCDLDREYPGKRVCIDDTLEPGKVYTRVSPPELRDEDLRIEDTAGPSGVPMVIAHCDKAGMSFNFDANIPRDKMLDFIRREYAKHETRFLVYVQPGVMTVQTYD